METFDFSQPGGFPLTQERLAWMQKGYITALNAVSGMAGTAAAASVTGVKLTSGDWVTGGVVSDGWVWHPTLGLMPFVGGAFTPSTMGVTYQDVTSPLTFGNNSQQNVQVYRVATIAPGAGLALKNLSETIWHGRFGKVARTEWASLSGSPISPGSPTINVAYKKDILTNSLLIRGTIQYANGNTVSLPPTMYGGNIYLPEGFRPTQLVVFPCYVRQHFPAGSVPSTASGPITEMQGQIGPDGGFAFSGIRANTAISYTAMFNHVIPLD